MTQKILYIVFTIKRDLYFTRKNALQIFKVYLKISICQESKKESYGSSTLNFFVCIVVYCVLKERI